jgi:hypothetical protein
MARNCQDDIIMRDLIVLMANSEKKAIPDYALNDYVVTKEALDYFTGASVVQNMHESMNLENYAVASAPSDGISQRNDNMSSPLMNLNPSSVSQSSLVHRSILDARKV